MIAELKEEYSELAEPEQFGVVVSVLAFRMERRKCSYFWKEAAESVHSGALTHDAPFLAQTWSPFTLMVSFLFLGSPYKPAQQCTKNLAALFVSHIAWVLKNLNFI